MEITIDDVLEPKSIYDIIVEAKHEAIRNGIKANSIVINDNLVRVPESFGEYQEMICGLKTYRTSCELPEDYVFAVFHNANTKPEPEMKWIPVTERKPQVGEWVLTYYEDKRHRVTKYDKYGFPILLTVGLGWVSVTHWMPLPEPPKGE